MRSCVQGLLERKWLRHRALRPTGRIRRVGGPCRPRREHRRASADRELRSRAAGFAPNTGRPCCRRPLPGGLSTAPGLSIRPRHGRRRLRDRAQALFDEKRKLRFPLQPTRDGKDWQAFDANLPAPTVGAELNKLATAVAMGRNFAGIHWRSDAWQVRLLGESVATAWLRAEKRKSIEGQQGGWLKGFEFTSFAGEADRRLALRVYSFVLKPSSG